MYNARERATIGMLKSGEVLGETKATETISTVKKHNSFLFQNEEQPSISVSFFQNYSSCFVTQASGT